MSDTKPMTESDLRKGYVTLSCPSDNDRNLLHTLKDPEHEAAFYARIEGHRLLLADLVAHHLGTSSTDVTVSPQDYWRHGSFNLCVPVHVGCANPNTPEHVMLRFPLPYHTGEAVNPGNADEKINAEAATYAWIQENCPSVPIPELYGFGFSTHQRLTRIDLLPRWSRWFQQARRRLLSIFGFRLPSKYVSHCSSGLSDLDTGYLLIQTIFHGKMLSVSWDEKRNDERLQRNLQRQLAKIMLSLARVPLTRIGSFRIDNNGYLHLDNRPLNTMFMIHEDEGIPLDIPRHTVFSSVDDFVIEHLAAFDNRLLHQPNAVSSRDDAHFQMASLAAARVVLPQMFRREFRHGPFVLSLTDLHRSNILVDDDWNITSIVDLEFTCSWPIEFVQPPYWLGGQGGQTIEEIDSDGYAPLHAAFVALVKEQEELEPCQSIAAEPLSSIMQQSWTNGAFWAMLAIQEPISFTAIFRDRILAGPVFSCPLEELDKGEYYRFFARLWRPRVDEVIDKKLQDRETYIKNLKNAFHISA